MSDEAPARGKSMSSWVGWLEMHEPDTFTLEDYRRLRAEAALEETRKGRR